MTCFLWQAVGGSYLYFSPLKRLAPLLDSVIVLTTNFSQRSLRKLERSNLTIWVIYVQRILVQLRSGQQLLSGYVWVRQWPITPREKLLTQSCEHLLTVKQATHSLTLQMPPYRLSQQLSSACSAH